MPRDKDRKRIIRNRMQQTGEAYTTARAHVLAKRRVKQQPPVDHAALAGMSDDKIAAMTGRTWAEWVRVLDAADAAALRHRDIAVLVHEKYGVGDWWTQTVTVGYERIKGLRERGQRRDGSYEVGKSRTFNVPVKTLFQAWADDAARRRWLDGVEPVVRTATPPKAIRLQWPDGTIVVAGFIAKSASRSAVSLAHTKLRSRSASDAAKKEWTRHLDALTALMTSRTAG